MNPILRSALIAGSIAFVIYLVISMSTGSSFGAAIGVAIAFFFGTAAVTFVISALISKSKVSGRS